MGKGLTRRGALAGGGAGLLLGLGVARAETPPIELSWDQLIPEDARGTLYGTMRALGIIEHGELSTGFDQELGARVTHEFDGKRVRLPGFAVPLDFEGTGTRQMLLVPYVGACIHVPPPPPNQIVFVRSETPYELTDYFDAIWVVGTFSTMAVATELAEIGYTLEAESIEPYE